MDRAYVDYKLFKEWTDNGIYFVSRLKTMLHIFEHFYQIKGHKVQTATISQNITSQHISSQRRGWGLGLAIVKELTELHKAKATVESHLGSGTTITIAFPVMTTTKMSVS